MRRRSRKDIPMIAFAQKISRIPHYAAGAESADAVDQSETLVMLASNESPFPPVQGVIDAVARAAGAVNRYPAPHAPGLRHALADRFEVPVSEIAVGNGSCEILLAAAVALLEPWNELVYAWPSFSIYPHLDGVTDAKAVRVPLADGFVHDLDAMLGAITDQTRLLIVCNPNNPTSTFLPSETIAGFLDEVPERVLVILDEAYIEFQTVEDPDTSIDLLQRFPNLAILRTFSKVYGLAGLRVGYALGPEQFVHAVNAVRQPFSVNHLAEVAAIEALRHQDDVARRAEWNAVERLWMEEELAELGFEVAESQANFCWVGVGELEEGEVMAALGRAGVAVRPGKGLGSPGFLRITYGTRAENERFIEALRACL
jgi:histidinol-phosphate aminotransferase